MTSHVKALTVAIVAALVLSACANTVRGVGRDVQQTADAVEDVAS
ncbi:MAG TPA: EncA/B family entericidin [Methylomirabilota bacterium]|nr:EncA/B family entericidin [Methylomirabilota bacterium]